MLSISASNIATETSSDYTFGFSENADNGFFSNLFNELYSGSEEESKLGSLLEQVESGELELPELNLNETDLKLLHWLKEQSESGNGLPPEIAIDQETIEKAESVLQLLNQYVHQEDRSKESHHFVVGTKEEAEEVLNKEKGDYQVAEEQQLPHSKPDLLDVAEYKQHVWNGLKEREQFFAAQGGFATERFEAVAQTELTAEEKDANVLLAALTKSKSEPTSAASEQRPLFNFSSQQSEAKEPTLNLASSQTDVTQSEQDVLAPATQNSEATQEGELAKKDSSSAVLSASWSEKMPKSESSELLQKGISELHHSEQNQSEHKLSKLEEGALKSSKQEASLLEGLSQAKPQKAQSEAENTTIQQEKILAGTAVPLESQEEPLESDASVVKQSRATVDQPVQWQSVEQEEQVMEQTTSRTESSRGVGELAATLTPERAQFFKRAATAVELNQPAQQEVKASDSSLQDPELAEAEAQPQTQAKNQSQTTASLMQGQVESSDKKEKQPLEQPHHVVRAANQQVLSESKQADTTPEHEWTRSKEVELQASSFVAQQEGSQTERERASSMKRSLTSLAGLAAQSAPEPLNSMTQHNSNVQAEIKAISQAQEQNFTQQLAQAQEKLQLLQEKLAPMLGQRLMLMMDKKEQQAEIQLDPPELGSLMVRVQVKNDQAQVSFVAQHPQARDALEQAMPRLRELMQQQQMELVNAEVSYQHRDGGHQQQGDSQERGQQGLLPGLEVASEEQLSSQQQQIMLQAGKVDFYA